MIERAPVADRAVARSFRWSTDDLPRLDSCAAVSTACASVCERRLDDLAVRLARLEALADGVDAGFDRLETQIAGALAGGRQLHVA